MIHSSDCCIEFYDKVKNFMFSFWGFFNLNFSFSKCMSLGYPFAFILSIFCWFWLFFFSPFYEKKNPKLVNIVPERLKKIFLVISWNGIVFLYFAFLFFQVLWLKNFRDIIFYYFPVELLFRKRAIATAIALQLWQDRTLTY